MSGPGAAPLSICCCAPPWFPFDKSCSEVQQRRRVRLSPHLAVGRLGMTAGDEAEVGGSFLEDPQSGVYLVYPSTLSPALWGPG